MNRPLKQLLSFIVPAAAAGLLYYGTMAPDVYVSDFAEFQYLPAKLGIPHPNGFPFFVLLAWLWSQVGTGTPAAHMNLFAVGTGALAVGATAFFVYQIRSNLIQAILTGLLLAMTPTLWKYSVAAERYGLNLLLLCGAFWSAWLAGRRPSWRWIAISGFLVALALTTHPTTAVIGPIWLLFLVSNVPLFRRSWRPWAVLILSGLPPLLFYLYIPWRWAAFIDAPLTPGIGLPKPIFQGMVPAGYQNQLTLSVIGEYLAFGTQMISEGRESFGVRLYGSVGDWWSNEFAWWLLGLVAIGLIHTWSVARWLTLAMLGAVAIFVLTVATTRGAKVDAYMLPATWLVLIVGGFGIDAIFGLVRQIRGRWLANLSRVLVMLLLAFLFTWRVVDLWAAHDQSRYIENRRDWETLLAHPLAKDSALLADWSDLTPFWYMQQIEEMRTDMIGLFPPQQSRIIDPWLQANQVLYLAAPLQHGYAANLATDYQLTPWGRTVLIQKDGALFSCPDTLEDKTSTPAEWPFTIEGWDAHFQEDVGGQVVRLFFCWSAPSGIGKNQFLTLDLVNNEGQSAATVNQPLLVTWYPLPGEQKVERGLGVIPLYLSPGFAAGTYQMRLTAFETSEDFMWQGSAHPPIVLDTVTTPHGSFNRYLLDDEVAPLLAPQASGKDGMALADLRLRAWSLSGEVVRPGDPIEVELIWESKEVGADAVLPQVQFQFWDWSGVQSTTPVDMLPVGGESLFRSKHILKAPVALGNASYHVEVQLVENGRIRPWRLLPKLWIGRIQVEDRAHEYDVPPEAERLEATFVDQRQQPVASLRGYHLGRCDNDQVEVKLVWEAHATTSLSYSVFVHAVDDSGTLVAQHDGIPDNGNLPTTLWIEGEIIVDGHMLNLPPERPNDLRIFTGLYTQEEGRLLTEQEVVFGLTCP